MTDRSVVWPGVPMALAAAVLFGAAAPFAKLLLGEVEPQLLAGLFYLVPGSGSQPCMPAAPPSASRPRKRRCAPATCPGSPRSSYLAAFWGRCC